jgi:hypothetical protein
VVPLMPIIFLRADRRYTPAMDLVTGLTGFKTASDFTTRLREALSREITLDEATARIMKSGEVL